MHRKNRKKQNFVYIFYLSIDILSILISFYVPCILRYSNIYNLQHVHLVYFFWGTILLILLKNNKLYFTARELTIPNEVRITCRSVLYSALIAAVVVFFLRIIYLSRMVFISNVLLLCITLAFWRIIKRAIIRNLVVKGYNNFNVLIVGAGEIGAELCRQIKQRPFLGKNIIGFLDDYKKRDLQVEGCNIVGGIDDFTDLVKKNFIDEVIITIPAERDRVKDIIGKSKQLQVSVKIVPDQFDEQFKTLNSYAIGHVSILKYSAKEFHKTEALRKRIADILISFIGLMLILPLLFIIALIIKLISRGPVFYVAKRYGKKAAPFNFYKFRTMVIDADKQIEELKAANESDGPIFKIKDDPRLTKFGRLIRAYSLDELPQLINVLKGDMSIVGPRPFPIGQLDSDDLRQFKRLEIKPGITGLWQVHGRSDASFQRLLKWDIWYMNNWSLWLDVVILGKTIKSVLSKKGAY